MRPTRWGVIMLLSKPHAAGLRILEAPWPSTQPPTIVMPATKVKPVEVAEHILSPELTCLQQEDMQRYADGLATGSSTSETNLVTHRVDASYQGQTSQAEPCFTPSHL